jgi:DNA processing protein
MPDPCPIVALGNEDARYPELLKRIADPPEVLYCRGNVALLDSFCFAVVGTRNVSDYGRQAAVDLAGNLAAGGMTIVSGLAIGIDALAHRAAMDAAGRTIAVLGTGIQLLWPRENERLGERILAEGGLVVSELPDTTPGGKHTFPRRNRIISGLSRGVLVVEADRQSGSLITAACALDQDRDVFAVPGSIYWPRSVGANWLIANGARVATTASDIREHYRLRQEPLPVGPAVSTDDPVQAGILALLRTNGPTHLEAIASAIDAQPARTMSAVMLLELKGALKHIGGGTYSV